MKKIFRMVGLCAASIIFCAAANAATFTVNTTNDTVDANPGDGIAADANGRTTLRAAVMALKRVFARFFLPYDASRLR